MRYQEYSPPSELAAWVKMFWVFECRSNDPMPETIVADGYPELVVHFGSPFSELNRRDQFQEQSSVLVCGQMTKPLVLRSSTDAGMIGIRFHPSGMGAFFSTPMNELIDQRVPAEHLFQDLNRLSNSIAESSNDTQRIAACTRFLTSSIDLNRDSRNIRYAVEEIIKNHGQVSVESVVSQLGMSRRSLEMAFQKVVGTSPKMYCRIIRFRHLFDTMNQESESVQWAHRALDSGFFDQSHMIRDFQRFTGQSPTSFLMQHASFAHSVNQG